MRGLKVACAALLLHASVDSNAATDVQCLGTAIHHESRGESLKGQRAVMDVILHRSAVYKKSLCQVVKQPKQFSFYTKKTKWLSQSESEEIIMNAFTESSIGKRTLYYHNHSVKPKWAKRLTKVKVIENHIFYRDNSVKEVVAVLNDENNLKGR